MRWFWNRAEKVIPPIQLSYANWSVRNSACLATAMSKILSTVIYLVWKENFVGKLLVLLLMDRSSLVRPSFHLMPIP